MVNPGAGDEAGDATGCHSVVAAAMVMAMVVHSAAMEEEEMADGGVGLPCHIASWDEVDADDDANNPAI